MDFFAAQKSSKISTSVFKSNLAGISQNAGCLLKLKKLPKQPF